MRDTDFFFGAVKKHWGTLYGYKPYKIYWSWGFYSSHSTGFFIKSQAAKKVGLYNLKYKYSSLEGGRPDVESRIKLIT